MTDERGRYKPFNIVEDLEYALCTYTNAPMCTVVDSCTNALGIVLEYFASKLTTKDLKVGTIDIPTHTYIGVPMQIKRAGFNIKFREEDWQGEYKLGPYNVWDSARRFRSDMWHEQGPRAVHDLMCDKLYKCVSFHRTKILGHTQGGAILHNDYEFQKYAKMMRFDGRTQDVLPQQDIPTVLGRHCYMDPETAAALLHNLYYLPDYNDDLPKSAYPDLSKMDIFK